MKHWSHLQAERILNDQIQSWWFRGKRTIFDGLFRGKIPPTALVLDVGAGQGLFVNHLAGPRRVIAVDEWWDCLERNRQRGGLPVRGDATRLPVRSDCFDYLFALDVLEHLPDDDAVVKEWARVLKPGGLMVINVPALDCLWSPHDVQMGHYRRYNRRKLARVLESNGLRCERLAYSNFFLTPIAWLIFNLKLYRGSESNPEAHIPVPKPVQWIITLCYQIEAAWLKRFSFPFGGSLIAIARKGHGSR